ncbi:MAG: hypothetical protein AVDCRST_MAG56-161, partial [uncultured Cytophagales bacterium]
DTGYPRTVYLPGGGRPAVAPLCSNRHGRRAPARCPGPFPGGGARQRPVPADRPLLHRRLRAPVHGPGPGAGPAAPPAARPARGGPAHLRRGIGARRIHAGRNPHHRDSAGRPSVRRVLVRRPVCAVRPARKGHFPADGGTPGGARTTRGGRTGADGHSPGGGLRPARRVGAPGRGRRRGGLPGATPQKAARGGAGAGSRHPGRGPHRHPLRPTAHGGYRPFRQVATPAGHGARAGQTLPLVRVVGGWAHRGGVQRDPSGRRVQPQQSAHPRPGAHQPAGVGTNGRGRRRVEKRGACVRANLAEPRIPRGQAALLELRDLPDRSAV